ncbi:MAG: acylphosphatase [Phycisphaerales bacterium JB064]
MAIRQAVRYLGTVQGVGFRATARSIAEPMPITGLVRNEPDGTVWLEAQGLPQDVEAYLGSLAQAMQGRIAQANRQDLPVREGEDRFVIAR